MSEPVTQEVSTGTVPGEYAAVEGSLVVQQLRETVANYIVENAVLKAHVITLEDLVKQLTEKDAELDAT